MKSPMPIEGPPFRGFFGAFGFVGFFGAFGFVGFFGFFGMPAV